MQAMSAGMSLVAPVPGARGLLDAITSRTVKGSTGGPDATARARFGSHVLARAYAPDGSRLAEVRVAGANAYDFTGTILAWGAETVASKGLKGTGALGPADGFGLDELEAGCREAGIERV